MVGEVAAYHEMRRGGKMLTRAHPHTHTRARLRFFPHNTYSPITARGRGPDPALPLTLFQDRLMRHRIAPADQISPFWPSLPGLGEICKCLDQTADHAVLVAERQLFFIRFRINKSRGHRTFHPCAKADTADPTKQEIIR